jgi:integrase
MAYSSVLLGSVRGTKPALGIPLAAYFHNRRFSSITHDEVASWFAQRVEGGAQATKHRVSKASRAFLRFAQERSYTTLDLGSAIDLYAPGGSRLEWLDWDEIHELIDAIPEPRYQLAVAWLFYTGCRVAEACAALQRDVQLRKEVGLYEWTIDETKTHVPRTVWLPSSLAERLEACRLANKPSPSWPVLWDCEGRGFARVESPTAPISPRMINATLERARQQIGLTKHLTAHVAKHSYCTNWIRDQGNNELAMEKLSRQVGTSVGVLRNTYVHISLTADDWAHLRAMGE